MYASDLKTEILGLLTDMLAALMLQYPVTDRQSDDRPGSVPSCVKPIFDAAAGSTLASGFYRFHTPFSAESGNHACAGLIQGFEGRFHCIGFDWLGREVAVDVRPDRGNGIIVVDPGGGEYLKTPYRLTEWHDAIASEDDPLAWSFYEEWRRLNPGVNLSFQQAVGYKVPLFLGGRDGVLNLEVIDREVYFELCTQLANGVATLPPGETISAVRLS